MQIYEITLTYGASSLTFNLFALKISTQSQHNLNTAVSTDKYILSILTPILTPVQSNKQKNNSESFGIRQFVRIFAIGFKPFASLKFANGCTTTH